MADRLKGKVAVITGAGSGIGAGIAKRFAAEGAKLIICGRRQDKLEETAAACPQGMVLPFPADVRKFEDAQAIAEAAIKFAGRIDILVNDAGIARRGGIVEAELDEWKNVMETNLFGPFYMMRTCIPHMIEGGGGSIVSISSLAGVRRIPQSSAYCASKEGLIGLAQSAAMDYGKNNIRSNVICPGFVGTENNLRRVKESSEAQGVDMDAMLAERLWINPIRRPVPIDEIAQAAVYFASDESTTVTGTVLLADAGVAIVDASIGARGNPH